MTRGACLEEKHCSSRIEWLLISRELGCKNMRSITKFELSLLSAYLSSGNLMSRMRKKQIESVSNVKKYIAMRGMKRIV